MWRVIFTARIVFLFQTKAVNGSAELSRFRTLYANELTLLTKEPHASMLS